MLCRRNVNECLNATVIYAQVTRPRLMWVMVLINLMTCISHCKLIII